VTDEGADVAKIRVVTDSACDLPDELAAELGIVVVPLSIRFGDEEFTDRKDLSPAQFWAKCKSSKVLPETAAPSPGAFQVAYEQARADGCDGVLVITLSAELSATHQAATLAAQAVESIPVRVVDSRAVTMAQGLMAVELATAAADGATLDQLGDLAVELIPRAGVIGTLDTLEHLIKGGRLKGAKALLGSMLSVKPLLELKDGAVVEAGRQRTRAKALATCVAAARAAEPLRRLALVHGNAADVDAVLEALKDVPSQYPLVVADMGSVVGTHGGPGIVGICWIRA
jgi:DegV family protein with EDD domain